MKKSNYQFAIDWYENEVGYLIGQQTKADKASLARELENIPIDYPSLGKRKIATKIVEIRFNPDFKRIDWVQDKLKKLYPQCKVEQSSQGNAQSLRLHLDDDREAEFSSMLG